MMTEMASCESCLQMGLMMILELVPPMKSQKGSWTMSPMYFVLVERRMDCWTLPAEEQTGLMMPLTLAAEQPGLQTGWIQSSGVMYPL